MTYSYWATTGKDCLFFLEMIQLHNQFAYNHHLLLRNKKLTGLWGKTCVVFENKEEHMLMTLVGDIQSVCCSPLIWRVTQCQFLFYFYIQQRWWQHCVLFTTLLPVYLFTAVVSVKSSFSPLRHTLWCLHPCVSEHMHLCTCTTHLLLQNNIQQGKPKCCPYMSHLNKCNRIWYSSRNHAYPHPHHLLTGETHCCWVWNWANKDSLCLNSSHHWLLCVCIIISYLTWYLHPW